MRIRNVSFFLPALAAAAVVAFATTPASAISITINSLAKLAGDTANKSQNNSTNAGEWLSSVSTVTAGTNSGPDALAGVAIAKTRYAGVLGSDSDALNFASRADSSTSSYRLSFTVTPTAATTVYNLAIATSWLGALVNRDEGGSGGVETIVSNVTGTVNNVANAGLGLAIAKTQSTNSNAVTNISQSNTLNINGLSGTQVFQLDFTWSQSTSSGNNVISGGDEAVVIFGLAGTATNFGASDDYPGTSGHTQANDGHFVGLSATIVSVPEPSSIVLAAMALCGLAVTVRRRRHA